jgi:hypothetical protein
MPLQATSGAASYDAFGGGAAAVPQYIEDVFSTYLYTGNESTQTINNGIDLSGKGGLVWIKSRSSFSATETQQPYHFLSDTTKTSRSFLSSNTTNALASNLTISSFNSNGFSLDDQPDGVSYGGRGNLSGVTYASWTFRKQPKFFDVVTWTGDGTSAQTIPHNLGSVPGCIIVKRPNEVSNWIVYHRGMNGGTNPLNFWMKLNLTDAESSGVATNFWANTNPTSTDFTVGSSLNSSSVTFVAYVFAHNAGGFGLTGTDNVISCGSFTCDGSGNASVNLGYEPQWVLMKASSTAADWQLTDTMRGMSQTQINQLRPNTSAAEGSVSGNYMFPTATGFELANGWGVASQTFIYIAIRRGPMKVPTDATKVFAPTTYTATGSPNNITYAVPFFDMVMEGPRQGSSINFWTVDRLRGATKYLSTSQTAAEATYSDFKFVNNDGFDQGIGSGESSIDWRFRRAPSYFDAVCYTGTGSARTVAHNLGVVPELMIVKRRTGGTANWAVYSAFDGATKVIFLDLTGGSSTSSPFWNNTAPTNTVFTVGSADATNASGSTLVAYLFATCPGVSKVGSYTGTGTTLQVNCGFTGGARFVLIKRTDSTGDWYVWDSARGIVSGNDPYLLLNSTAAEVTNTDYVDTYSAGFEISSTAPAAINASGGTFIFLAIA